MFVNSMDNQTRSETSFSLVQLLIKKVSDEFLYFLLWQYFRTYEIYQVQSQ